MRRENIMHKEKDDYVEKYTKLGDRFCPDR